MIPENQLFDVYVDTLYLDDIRMESLDNLSGYSSLRMTFGAIRDEAFGLTTRSCALSLVPISDTLDFGSNPKLKSFGFNAVNDTVSCVQADQAHILQNIKVHDLEEIPTVCKDSAWSSFVYSSDVRRESYINLPVISKGIPTYGGGDTLGFFFTDAFAQKYMDKMLNASKNNVYVLDTIPNFIKMLPGIIISSDLPDGNGGRINMFDISIYTEDSYVKGNFAELKFNSTYDGVQKDTSFLFFFGPATKIKYNKNSSSPTMPTQYAFNLIEHESQGKVISGLGESFRIEGGTGLKPVISAKEIRDKLVAKMTRHGVKKVDEVVINRSSMILPFIMPEDYTRMGLYPTILNPTCKIFNEESEKYNYASITDATVSAEDEGDINRSLLNYAPDISFHTQEIVRLKDDAVFSNYDLWMLIMKEETYKTTSSSSSSSNSDYYNYLMMMQYLYGGYGYGSYGGYGGYGYSGYGGYGGYGSYGYNNYYNYYLYNMMYNQSQSSSSSSSTATQLDIDRYYDAVLAGPQAKGDRPRLVVVYSVPETAR
ncbi:MAG: hypothetical protein HUJ94_00860 [Bacteroidales bacterium]|nr:hypothetical protein [Bacteroidales bacterium]